MASPSARQRDPGKTLRDPVHGDIALNRAELAVLDTPAVQRLRGIRQLGAALHVYPGAQHSRFEHAVGTAWMARRIVERLEARGEHRFDDVERQAVVLAALAHDVTHIPFGHTFEDERKLLERHDSSVVRFEHFCCGDGPLAQVLETDEPGRLAREIVRPGGNAPPLLHDIVAGTICADLLDYLRRDNYFCGLSLDYDDRVFDYFAVHNGRFTVDLQRRGLFRHDALSEITNLLRIRYVLSERVYYHHAKIAAGVMISKAIERAMAAGMAERDLYDLTDDALVVHLAERYGTADLALAEIVEGFRTRRLYKRCYMVSRSAGEDVVADLVRRFHENESGARGDAERRIAQELGAGEHEVAIYCAPASMALKEANVPVRLPDRNALLSEMNTAEIQVLKDKHREIWRCYVFVAPRLAEARERAGRAAEDTVGQPNELPADLRGGRL